MTMREILFRGKHVLDGRWIEGFYNGVRPDLATMQTKECHRIFSLKSLAYDVVPDTIGQYTGLTDKNGKKIFEGDFVRLSIAGVFFNAVCKFHSGSFGLVWHYMGIERWQAFTGMCHVEYEVIGNIYDNPELMEDK